MISSPVISKLGFLVDSVKEWFWFLCKPRVVNIANFYRFWKHLIYIMTFLNWFSSLISSSVSHCHLVLGNLNTGCTMGIPRRFIVFLLIYLVSGLLWETLTQLTGMKLGIDNKHLGGTGLFCSLTTSCDLCLYFLSMLPIELICLPCVLGLFPIFWEFQT